MKRFAYLILFSAVLTSCQESLEDRCMREAKEFTQKYCPSPIARDIMQDSMVFYKSTHTLAYYYSLSGQLDNEELMNDMRDTYYEQLLIQVRNATSLKTYKEAGYTFSYIYHSASKPTQELLGVTFTAEDYK